MQKQHTEDQASVLTIFLRSYTIPTAAWIVLLLTTDVAESSPKLMGAAMVVHMVLLSIYCSLQERRANLYKEEWKKNAATIEEIGKVLEEDWDRVPPTVRDAEQDQHD